MNKRSFPTIALSLGLLLTLLLAASGALGPAVNHKLPLLTLLIVSEFGFIVTAIGVGIGIHTMAKQGMRSSMLFTTIGCGMLMVGFLYLGLQLWPGALPTR